MPGNPLAAKAFHWWHGATFTFAQHLKTQCARRRDCLDQAHRDRVAEAIGFAGSAANQGVRRLGIVEEVVAQGRDGHEAIGTGVAQLDEQALARHARDTSLERGANAVGQVESDQPVDGFAFGRHGAAFGVRDGAAHVGKLGNLAVFEAALA